MKNIFKRFSLFLFVLLFLEIVFQFIAFNHLSFETIINVLLYSIIISGLLSILSGIFNNKTNHIITSIILFIIGVLFCIQLVFYNVFKAFVSFSILGLGDQLNSFMGETIRAIIDNGAKIVNIFPVLHLIPAFIKENSLVHLKTAIKDKYI